MVFRTKNGTVVTDEMIEQWAENAEKGLYPGTPGTTVTRPQFGRPRLYAEPLASVTFRLREEDLQLADGWAKDRGVSRSIILRELVERGIRDVQCDMERSSSAIADGD
ncbi:hypothetical protein [Bifidobacterium oedipodis]|uniref:Toxin-antitoxin system, antitoxin component n=1 Tax=Bifidobacterium oedipodis TaxID=2675322 RepID=A0A7Y0EQ85_9BIFI|nr:hypothetical protein [Bifidobacterium sp. DSM 109957]NMM93311.1 toxin-antitoxin system, antitoxin component [Bifidobacterium sp. DSM 109957]